MQNRWKSNSAANTDYYNRCFKFCHAFSNHQKFQWKLENLQAVCFITLSSNAADIALWFMLFYRWISISSSLTYSLCLIPTVSSCLLLCGMMDCQVFDASLSWCKQWSSSWSPFFTHFSASAVSSHRTLDGVGCWKSHSSNSSVGLVLTWPF